MPDLAPEALAELRRLLADGTPGPWSTVSGAGNVWHFRDEGAPIVVAGHQRTPRVPDALLIAAAVNALPALLDAAEERDALAAERDAAIDVAHLDRQRVWSAGTFGPAEVRGHRGILDHIRKELAEIEAEPGDVTEWADLVLLAFDGAWRSGHAPADTVAAIKAKQARNEARTWPDWRTADPNKAIEHVRALDLDADR